MERNDYQRIAQAIRYLQDQAENQPSLDEVATQVGLSPYYFQRMFKAWAGVSPKRFLQYLTVEHAKKRLLASASVLDTALDVGLSGPGRLHDLFVAIEAMTPGEFKSKGAALQISYGFHATPFGECLLAISPRGICGLSFVEPFERAGAVEALRNAWQKATIFEHQEAGKEIIEQIFGQGSAHEQRPIRIHLGGTNFQIKVWEALLRIPEGAVVSYASLADAVGHPAAHRAVGTAVGLNPIAYLIPCHRVLRGSGDLGGYRWGTTRKQLILAREAAICAKHKAISGPCAKESIEHQRQPL